MNSIPPLDKFGYIRALRGAGLTAGEFRVLIAVWDHSDRNGQHAYASAARIAKDCGIAERVARRYLATLVRKKFLRRVQRGGYDSGPRASEYALSLPAWLAPSGVQPAKSGRLDEEPTGQFCTANRPDLYSQPATGVTPTEPLTEPRTEPSETRAREPLNPLFGGIQVDHVGVAFGRWG